MIIHNYNDVIERKIEQRKIIPEIEYHFHGHCIHIGKISPGCRGCFTREDGGGLQIGEECMCNCPMCYYDPNRSDKRITSNIIGNRGSKQYIAKFLGEMTEKLYLDDFKPICYSYQSSGETLLYIDTLEKFSEIIKKMNEKKNINIYTYVYTNGILANKNTLLRLKDMGVHEIRFHISASNFSKDVIKNMYESSKMNFRVTIEEPSWPLHKEKLFSLLEEFNNIGVKHLNMVETQVTEFNIENLDKYYPGMDVGIYKDFFWHLYDNGMVYDIMKEVIDKKYSYSVLDCNSAVERCRHASMNHIFYDESFIDGMCDSFNYFSRV